MLVSIKRNYRKKDGRRNSEREMITMEVGDTFKVRKPPNSLFLDTMDVLNKESWTEWVPAQCSSYQWGVELTATVITLHSLHHCHQSSFPSIFLLTTEDSQSKKEETIAMVTGDIPSSPSSINKLDSSLRSDTISTRSSLSNHATIGPSSLVQTYWKLPSINLKR